MEDSTASDFEYRGYTVKWTGWKQRADNILLCAQWVANKPGLECMVYCTVPYGGVKAGKLTDFLDITPCEHWSVRPVTVFTDEDEKQMWMDQGRNTIKEAIDRFIDVNKEELPAPAPTYGYGGYYTTSSSPSTSHYINYASNYASNYGSYVTTTSNYTFPQQVGQVQQGQVNLWSGLIGKGKKKK